MNKLIIALISVVTLSGCVPKYSEGTRVGVITKLSYKGIFWKSWEGSINQGGTKQTTDSEGNSQVVTNAIEFNVSNPEIIDKLKAAVDSGNRVEITYRQWLIHPLSIDNEYVVVDVKETK